MKSTSKRLTRILAVSIVAVTLLGSSIQVFAQVPVAPKPKGKPWPAPEEFVKMKNPIVIDDSTLIKGKDLYIENCKSCHGVKGKGDGTKAEKIEILCGDFTSPEFIKETDGELYWKTTDGRKPMPSFNEKLSDNERWQIIYYVRSLGKIK